MDIPANQVSFDQTGSRTDPEHNQALLAGYCLGKFYPESITGA